MRMIGIPKNFIGTRPGRVYSWGDSASIQTASGTAVTFPQATERPLSGLNIYGYSTQDGAPSPENPVPIVSAGSVMTTGAQLLDFGHTPVTSLSDKYEVGYTVTKDGLTATVQADGGIKITGTKTTEGWTNIFWVIFQESNLLSIPAGEYTFTGNKQYQAISIRISGSNYSNTFTLDDDSQINGYYIAYNGIQTVDDIVYLMLNSGSTALPWEPYTGGVPGVNPYAGEINVSVSDNGTQSQTLTLSTPGGLPGIPVDSGGNYTDENGQQWICDEIDLKRGKYVKRVEKIVIDGEEMKFTPDGVGLYWNLPQHSAEGIIYLSPIMSMYFPRGIFSVNNDYDFIFTTSTAIGSYFSSVNDLNEFCTEKSAEGQPLELYYGIDPIETDLTDEEIDAYKALRTYTPNTTVSNDAEAWIKVGYRE